MVLEPLDALFCTLREKVFLYDNKLLIFKQLNKQLNN